MNAIDNELSPLRIPDLEDELTAVLCAAISWGGSVISSEEYVAAKQRFRAAVNAAIEADRKRRGEPIGYIMPTALKQLRAGGNAIVGGLPQGGDVAVYLAPQAAEPFKSRRIDDALRGLQASVAVGSDGEWVSIRREARDAAVKRLQELNSDCAHLYESYVEAVKKPAPQPAEPDLAKCAECGAEMIHVRPGKWQHPDCPQSPRAAEPVNVPVDKAGAVGHVFSLVRRLKNGESVEDQLRQAIRGLAAEPVKKKDWNVELSSWSDEDFVQVFHERPDLADRLRRVLAEPAKRERRYAQGTALGEFGIIPMCDQVDDEPVSNSLSNGLPEGHVLVPKHPTATMLSAAQRAWLQDPLRRTTTLWDAMLAAAPKDAEA